MQTFLPYANFAASARVLDYQRLGKQRIEVVTLLKAMNGMTKKSGYANHLATTMWRGFQFQLCQYGLAVCREWIGRGYKDTQLAVIESFLDNSSCKELPWWIGIDEFHYAHQSNLIRKMPTFYESKFGYFVPNDLPYLWPTTIGGPRQWLVIEGKRRWLKDIYHDVERDTSAAYDQR